MASVLLDTCVISELRRPDAEGEVVAAVNGLGEGRSFLSVITIGEIAYGARRLREGGRRSDLEDWLRTIERRFGERILGVGMDIARLWGQLTADAEKIGRQIGAADGLIAATAHYHGMEVMTRNVDDFKPMGVTVLNPWPN